MNIHWKRNKSPLVRDGILYRSEASQSFHCKDITCIPDIQYEITVKLATLVLFLCPHNFLGVLAYYLACLKDYQSVCRQLHLQNKPLCLQPDLQIRKLAVAHPFLTRWTQLCRLRHRLETCQPASQHTTTTTTETKYLSKYRTQVK